jgi:hypothetical protein
MWAKCLIVRTRHGTPPRGLTSEEKAYLGKVKKPPVYIKAAELASFLEA